MKRVHTSMQMIQLVSQAIERHQPEGVESIDEEHLILLASGRLNELAPADRTRLLRQVAAEPWAAQVVQQIRELGLEQAAAVPVIRTWRLPMRTICAAMAACLLGAATVWYVGNEGSQLGPGGYPAGIRNSDQQVFEAYLQRAQAGDPDAMEGLARCYDKGIGVQRDPEAAKYWQDKAKETRAGQ